MPLLPDKFAVGARQPQNMRSVAGISYDSPTYQAGEGLGRAITGLGSVLRPKEKETPKPAEEAQAISEAVRLIDTARRDFDAMPDPGQAGIQAADYLEQSKSSLLGRLSPQGRERVGPAIEALFTGQAAMIGQQIEPRQRELRIAEVETLFPQLAAQHAVLTDPTARQEIGAALFGSIDKLAQAGDIDAGRAQAMKLGLQRQLVRADVLAQPAQWRAEHLRPGGEGRFFRDALGAEDADFLHAQAAQEQVLSRRETGTQDLLQRFGSSAEGEEKALAEIAGAQDSDPAFKALYLGKLAAQRTLERREVAASAGNAYRLAVEGRDGEIDPADRLRLHKAGQMDGLLEAAQFARHANPKGDLLFKERLLAMAPQERAGYGVGELAKRLSPQDFLEVTQAAAGEEDQTQRARMEGFVQAVRPMLRAVTLGEKARPEQVESDRRLLALIHDEVQVLVGDEEKKKERPLTATEYQEVMRQAADRALLRSASLEIEAQADQIGYDVEDGTTGGDTGLHEGSVALSEAFSDAGSPSSVTGSHEGFGMPSATPEGYNIAALYETDPSVNSEPRVHQADVAQLDDTEVEDGGGEPGTLLAQGKGGGGGGNRSRGVGGPPGRSGAPDLEKILTSRENAIRRLEPNNPQLSYIRDRNIPPSKEFLNSMAFELEAAAFRVASKISFGHGYRDHAREFGRYLTPGDYAAIAQSAIVNPTRWKELAPGTFAYYQRSQSVVVIVDHTTFDRGTMFPVPRGPRGERYFNELEKSKNYP